MTAPSTRWSECGWPPSTARPHIPPPEHRRPDHDRGANHDPVGHHQAERRGGKGARADDEATAQYLLQGYLRHRYLESAGRSREILEPELTVYRSSLFGQPSFKLEGLEQVEMLYRHLTDTDQCVFYVEDELVAVGDHVVMGRGTSYQQTLGSALIEAGVDADPGAMYLTKSQIAMIWP